MNLFALLLLLTQLVLIIVLQHHVDLGPHHVGAVVEDSTVVEAEGTGFEVATDGISNIGRDRHLSFLFFVFCFRTQISS